MSVIGVEIIHQIVASDQVNLLNTAIPEGFADNQDGTSLTQCRLLGIGSLVRSLGGR